MIALSFALAALACGGADETISQNVVTDVEPLISAVAPGAGQVGDAIQLFGIGFSVAPPENVVTVGGTAAFAATYALNPGGGADAVEVLTFTVPAGAAVGTGPIFVTVDNFTSNTNLTFTVNP